MRRPRRLFLKQIGGVVSMLVGSVQLVGCSENSVPDSGSLTTTTESSSSPPTSAVATPASVPTVQSMANRAPVWDPAPTIEFVEGVPATISVRSFVKNPDSDPLTITLKSGRLLPGITWNPDTATIAYDGRPLGAKPGAPVVMTGLTFAADDGKN